MENMALLPSASELIVTSWSVTVLPDSETTTAFKPEKLLWSGSEESPVL